MSGRDQHRRRLAGVVALAAALALAAPAAAQESFFSLQFLGIREETADARARALGVLGVSLGDEHTAASLNPASFARLDRMTISAVGTASTRTARDSVTQHDDSDATFPHLRGAMPLPGRVVFSLGFVGLRNYRNGFELPRESVGAFGYRHTFEREGSLYSVPIGFARSVNSRLHLGLTIDFVLGTVNDAWTTGGDSLLALRTRRRDGMDGTTVTLGVLADPLRWLRLGGTWSPGVDLDVETRTTIEDGHVGGTTTPLRNGVTRSKAHYPTVWTGGASIRLGPKWLLSADYLQQDWGEWTGRLYGADAATTEWRVGGGIEARPHRSPRWRRLAYRAGVGHAVWGHELGGSELEQTSVHLGAGWALRDELGRLDLALEYTRVGDLGSNGYEESRWGFVFSLSGQETWRRRSPRSP